MVISVFYGLYVCLVFHLFFIHSCPYIALNEHHSIIASGNFFQLFCVSNSSCGIVHANAIYWWIDSVLLWQRVINLLALSFNSRRIKVNVKLSLHSSLIINSMNIVSSKFGKVKIAHSFFFLIYNKSHWNSCQATNIPKEFIINNRMMKNGAVIDC